MDLIYVYTFLKIRELVSSEDLYGHITINWLNIGYLEAITGPLKLIECLFGW